MRATTITMQSVVLPLLASLCACAGTRMATGEPARRQVEATERAFAKTMADRDFSAFEGFLSHEAIFFSGDEALRGKAVVAQRWSSYFRGANPPFSWSPDRVEVLESGLLALSTGPVLDSSGQLIGRFASIWRQEKPGVWRIVFDRGESGAAR
jgi:ketosteroid isomerase-like protein